MRILQISVLSSLLLLLAGCGTKWHVLEFQNVSDEVVDFKTEGIQLYAEGGGPQRLGGPVHPGRAGSYSVMGPLRLRYPVRVSWTSQQSDKHGAEEFMDIPGLPAGLRKVKEGGVLVVGVTPDFRLKLFFMPGDTIETGRYQQILKGNAPFPFRE